MASLDLSVVIPTHKRAAILRACLEALEKQTIATKIEVIVVSDGHDDDTVELMRHIEKTEHGPHPSLGGFHFLEIPKAQQGTARNRGTERASAPTILFLGDDMLLASDACERHLAAAKNDRATLGHITWDPAVGITPVMAWLEKTGWQFGYPMIAHHAHATIPRAVQHRFTYTGNLSVPTAIAKKFPFREDVSLYGWEDILWGTQLQGAGIELFYEPNAKALHHHRLDMTDSLKRMHTLGKSLTRMEEIDPTFDRIPRGMKLAKHRIAAMLPGMRGAHERAFLSGFGNH